MADILPIIETIKHRWMRAWVGRDAKALTSRDFMLLIAPQVAQRGLILVAGAGRGECSVFALAKA